MPHFDPLTATAVSSHGAHAVSTNMHTYAPTLHIHTASTPQIITMEEERLEQLDSDPDWKLDWHQLPKDHPRWIYCKSRMDDAEKALCATPPYTASSPSFILGGESNGSYGWNI